MSTYVVIGGGLAGAKSVEALRDLDGDARIVLIGGESHLPYERPPLSKDHLWGEKALEDFTPLAAGWFTDNQVEARLGVFAINLDAPGRIVHLSDGRSIRYDGLVLATGSRPRSLDIPGIGRPGVQVLRTLEDSDALAAAFDEGGRLVIYGGGWIGLEVAAAARRRDVPVTIIVRGDAILRELGDDIASRFLELHRRHGVEFVFDSTIAGIEGVGERGPVKSVTLDGGRSIDAAHVLIAAGAEPRLELAREAQLEIDGGVLVDDTLATSDPYIVAVGDIAAVANPWVGERIRVEHWAAALNQPAIAAHTLVGDEAHFDEPPYFFTDQYDVGMEFRGVIPAGATMIQRDEDDGYLVFWLRPDGVPRAAMNVNVWDKGEALDALLRAGAPVDPVGLADPGHPLEAL